MTTPADTAVEDIDALTEDDVDALAIGATLLGSGGGGGVLIIDQLLRASLHERDLPVLSASALPSDSLVIHVGNVGAPDVLSERLVEPGHLALAIQTLARHLGVEPAAVGIIEIGGMNALSAPMAATALHLPVVDGDLMGRAYPRISQTTLAAHDHPAVPMSLVGPNGSIVLITQGSYQVAEDLTSASVAAMGGAAALAIYPVRADTLSAFGISGSLSTCVTLGRRYLSAVRMDARTLPHALNARDTFEGRVEEISARVGTEPGSMTVVDHRTGLTIRVDHHEEFLALSIDGQTHTATPDIIVVLDPITSLPLRTDQVRLGQSVLILTMPALYEWPAASSGLVGPSAFGFDLPPRDA